MEKKLFTLIDKATGKRVKRTYDATYAMETAREYGFAVEIYFHKVIDRRGEK